MTKYLGEEGLKQLINLIKDNSGGEIDYSEWLHPSETTFVIGDNSSENNVCAVFDIWGGLQIVSDYVSIDIGSSGGIEINGNYLRYKGYEVATENDLKGKQDTLEYYSEETGGAYGSTTHLDAGIVYYGEYEVLNAGNAIDYIVPKSISATVSGSSTSGKINVTVSPSYACKGVIFYPITDKTTYTIDPEGNYTNNTEVYVYNYTIRVYSVLDQSVYTDVILNADSYEPDPEPEPEPVPDEPDSGEEPDPTPEP